MNLQYDIRANKAHLETAAGELSISMETGLNNEDLVIQERGDRRLFIEKRG